LIVGFGKVRLVVRRRERALDDYRSADSLAAFSTKIKLAPSPPQVACAIRSIAIAFVFVLVDGRSVASLYRNDLSQLRLVNLSPLMSFAADSMATLPLLRVLRDQGLDGAVLERTDLSACRVVNDHLHFSQSAGLGRPVDAPMAL
jgi:hypothetical protein